MDAYLLSKAWPEVNEIFQKISNGQLLRNTSWKISKNSGKNIFSLGQFPDQEKKT